jgi:hypothetical protein
MTTLYWDEIPIGRHPAYDCIGLSLSPLDAKTEHPNSFPGGINIHIHMPLVPTWFPGNDHALWRARLQRETLYEAFTNSTILTQWHGETPITAGTPDYIVIAHQARPIPGYVRVAIMALTELPDDLTTMPPDWFLDTSRPNVPTVWERLMSDE